MKISRNVTDIARSSWMRLQICVCKLLSRFTRRFDDKIVELMIAVSFYSSEGRTALAEAMVAPLRRSLGYQGVGRRLLMVDELPQGAYARYERDPRSTASVRGVGGDRLDSLTMASAVYSTYAGNASYQTNESNRGGDLFAPFSAEAMRVRASYNQVMREQERPATADDIRRVQEQLAQTANDPNFTIVTSSGFDMNNAVFGHFWASDVHISDPYFYREEAALCEYLVWQSELKTQERILERRKRVANPIMEIELGG